MDSPSLVAGDFERDVVEKSRTIPVVVDFWAEWCAPCKVLGPVLERLAARDAGRWVLEKVDTDRNQDIAVRYGIRGIPSVKLFVDGKVAAEFTGALPEYAVDQWLRKSLPDPNREALAFAETLLTAGKEGEAIPVLEDVLRRDGANHHGRVLLARALLAADRTRALELLRPIEADSPHFAMAEALRTVADLETRDAPLLPEDPVKPLYLDAIRALRQGEYSQALERFIEVIRTNRFYDDDGARRACIAIFMLLGEDHAEVQKWRRDFSSALYV